MFAKKKRKEKKQIFNPTISNLSRLSRKDMCQRGGLIPTVSNSGIEENDKKKPTKIVSGSFWKINVKGVRFAIFLAYKVEKNNKIRVMLLVKEANVVSITLELVLPTLQKHKKCYFSSENFLFLASLHYFSIL